jgi:hypothetical protein
MKGGGGGVAPLVLSRERERNKVNLCGMFCCWRNQQMSSYRGVDLDVRHVLCVLTCWSGRVCVSSNCIILSDWQASRLAMFLSKVCRMHRNILEHCQSHVCLVDPASLAPWLADLTLPDRPIDLLPLIAKGYRYISVCWNRFRFNVISINPLKATRSEYFSLPYLRQTITFWKVPRLRLFVLLVRDVDEDEYEAWME